jgi:regulator of sirC expression with transglutaminase-like and TPR domain
MNQENPRARFKAIAEMPDADIDIAEAALVIAAETDDEVDISRSLDVLNATAQRFEQEAHNHEFGVSVSQLIDFIHQREGYSGNVRDYYDPANSYLNRVLELKVGIPITLAIVHIALGQRLDIPVFGVNFPGHFLVKYGNDNRLMIDPFSGRMLSESDCGTLLKQIAGPKATLRAHFFEVASNKDILLRILDNLKQIFWREKSWQEARQCIERQQLLKPEEDEYTVQLGALFEMQGNLNSAQLTYAAVVQESSDQRAIELASKRLLALGNGARPTVH